MTGFLDGQVIESGGYVIDRSLRFSAASSNYLARTPASAGNRKTWTWSGWVKRGALPAGSQLCLFSAATAGSNADLSALRYSGDQLQFFANNGTNTASTSALYRDSSSYYHILAVLNTNGVANGFTLYVNGVAQALTYGSFTADLQPSFNNNVPHNIGAQLDLASGRLFHLDGYLSEVHFIDGQALTPSSFGETNIETGEWVAKPYTGTYGTNGFYLDFSDGTSTTTLGYDAAGSNDWTLTNFTRSAGVNDCWMKDVPAGNGESSAVQPSGNYAVLNPLNTGSALSRANLRATSNSAQNGCCSNLPIKTTTYYEVTPITVTSTVHFGVIQQNPSVAQLATTANADAALYRSDGAIFRNTGSGYSQVQIVASYTTTDVVSCVVDPTNLTIQFYKNGSTVGTPLSLTSTVEYLAYIHFGGATAACEVNFGQRSFAYTPPTGFKTLCTSNLPTPPIPRGDNHFFPLIWTGNGATPRNITGLRFQPDLVWPKCRSTAGTNHRIFDVVRGVSKELRSDSTAAELTDAAGNVSAFLSNGFTVSGSTNDNQNLNGRTYVSWNWKAGGAAVSNTSGSITSSVSANVTAGFSVVTFTGIGAAATVGHGLGKVPRFIIYKNRDAAGSWVTGHANLTSWANTLYLDLTNAQAATANAWNNTAPTSTVFSVGSFAVNTNKMVAYCFAEIEGFSKFGSYTGNGSANGPFVFTGFKPRWFLVKNVSSATDWYIHDTARDTFNPANKELFPNTADAEVAASSVRFFDIVSNGFKVRGDNAGINANGSSYIYWAIADIPLNYSNAR